MSAADAPVRVSFVALNYSPSSGGSQEYVQRVAEDLVAHGHDVEVLTTDALRSPTGRDPGRVGVPDETIAGVRVRRFVIPEPIRWVQLRLRALRVRAPGSPPADELPLGPWWSGPLSPGLARAVRRAERDRDVVVACSAPFATFVLPTWRRRGRARVVGLPFLHTAKARPHRSVVRALRRCDAVVAMTDAEVAEHRDVGVDAARIHVVPPGTDVRTDLDAPEARRLLGLPEGPTVGFVGRLAAYKGIDTLLAAAPAVWRAHPGTTVLVAGASTGWAGLVDAVAATGIPEQVEVRADVDAAERDLLLAACDVVALPSREESFGLVILEAWAAGRAVVAADIAAVRSTVRDGADGLLVPPGDAAALAAAVAGLLGDADRRGALAAAGRARVEAEHRWPAAGRRWAELLGSLPTGAVA